MNYFLFHHRLEPGRVILKEGHPASGFYFLISGSSKLYNDIH